MPNYAYISFYIQDIYIDPSDYEKQIREANYNFYHKVNKKLYKLYITFTVQSDNGLILENEKEITKIKLNSKI